MSTVRGVRAVAVATALLGAAGGIAWWQWPLIRPIDAPAKVHGEPFAYQATVVRTERDATGSRETRERIARRGNWTRSEWSEGDATMALITRPDLNVTWLVDLSRGAYSVAPIAGDAPESALGGESIEELVRSDGGDDASVTVMSTADERYGGHPCRVVRSTIRGPGDGATESAAWVAQDLEGLVIRSELVGPGGVTSIVELVDISLSPVDALFELPPGAQLVERSNQAADQRR